MARGKFSIDNVCLDIKQIKQAFCYLVVLEYSSSGEETPALPGSNFQAWATRSSCGQGSLVHLDGPVTAEGADPWVWKHHLDYNPQFTAVGKPKGRTIPSSGQMGNLCVSSIYRPTTKCVQVGVTLRRSLPGPKGLANRLLEGSGEEAMGLCVTRLEPLKIPTLLGSVMRASCR